MNYQKKVLSQFGQDGILEKIFEIIGSKNKYFVEFGSNGTRLGQGNTAYLREALGFDGLLMDKSESPYNEKVVNDYPVKYEFVKATNINDLLKKYNVPEEIDLLSIDIDGQDFHVWNQITNRARVVVIESNYHMLPTKDLVHYYNENHHWNGSHLSGSSTLAIMKLGNKKGYTLVAISGCDLIFIRDDLCSDISFEFKNDNVALWNINIEQGYNVKVSESTQNEFDTCGMFHHSSNYI
jgi:hypothetical protein